MEGLRQEHLVRLGQHLIRSTDRLSWIFSRVSDWERDQHITGIQQQHGPAFTRNMSIADKFASEWSSVLGIIHRKQPLQGLNAAVKQFVHIPTKRVILKADNAALLVEISEAEVLIAIAGLSRRKSAGPDGLNNDFFKDTTALMVPALVGVRN